MSSAELWVIAATIIFAALIWRPAKKALGSGLETRRNQIMHDLNEANRLRAEAEALLADARQRQESATRNAADIVAFAKAEVARMHVRAEGDMKQSIARRERQATDRIAQAETSALTEIRSRAVDLALETSAQLLSEKLPGDKGNQILDDVIATLPAKLANAR